MKSCKKLMHPLKKIDVDQILEHSENEDLEKENIRKQIFTATM